MGTRKQRGGSLPGIGAFCCGLGIIIASTILNLAHDRLPERDIASLPFFLAPLYEASGKFGVTLVLVTLGLSIILLGVVFQRPRRVRGGSYDSSVPRTPVFYSSTDDGQHESHPNGLLVLQTRKYLAQANLSGATGFPAPRMPAPSPPQE